MEFNRITPEQAGISSNKIREYLKVLENAKLSTHSLIMAKGNSIFFEKYYEPFGKDFLHRMYSVSKSFVSLAIGFAMQDKLLNLDDKIVDYFPDESKNVTDENVKNQTIRHMLMMATAKPSQHWFNFTPLEDRVAFYFNNTYEYSRPSGTIFQYDSSGSFVLCSLVEKLTGMPFMEYLRIKLFDKIGVSKEAYCLKCPGGHSWGDSGILCTSLDLLKTGRFVMDEGMVNGEQVLDREYIREAVKNQIDNSDMNNDSYDSFGYGYQFWRTRHNGYFFNGMGCQLCFCMPDKDILFVYTGDNQGNKLAKSVIAENFFKIIYENLEDNALPADEKEEVELKSFAEPLKLFAMSGKKHTEMQDKINGKQYILDKNPMGISKIKLTFENDGGRIDYTNAQGDKTLKFKMCENEFQMFPQTGYSDEMGGVYPEGHAYKCAVSAAWVSDFQLSFKVQIIDNYFGILNMNFGFRDEFITVEMVRCAEDFLDEYEGFAGGRHK